MYNCTKINQQTMKKILLAVIVSLSIIVIPSCKKGEDDPFISIRSRDARITAKWKLVNLESTSSGPSSTTTSVLNGSLLTVTYTSPSYGSSSSTSSYSLDLEINSDGTSSSTEILDGDISTSKSTWNWKNDNNDKTSIYLYGGNAYFFGGSYTVDRLSSKELILRYESSSSSTSNSQTTTSNNKDVLTFEKQ